MLGFLRKNLQDAHLYTLLNQIGKSAHGLLAVILTPLFLTHVEQGYWFTFTSLSALVMLADLGFSNILLQFAAHEFAHLQFNQESRLIGNDLHLKRFSAFFRFSIKWTSFIIVIAFPIILSVGFFLLSREQTGVLWMLPWLLYGLASSIAFFNSSMLYFFEGCDLVALAQRIRMILFMVMTPMMCLGLFLGWGLFALSVSLLVSSLAGFFIGYKRFSQVISQLIKYSDEDSFPWREECLPLLWKYAISWASGYFIFQIYTPVMFHYHGAVEAGKIGISITLWMGVFSVANTWISVVTPNINILVSRKAWVDLDQLFFKNLFRSGLMFLVGMGIILYVTHTVGGSVFLMDRFVDIYSMYFLGIGWFCQIIVNGVAIYLRAHKEEPLAMPSLLSSIYILITTFLCAKYLAPHYFFLGYVSHYFWGIPWLLFLFKKKRRDHLPCALSQTGC